LVVVSRPPDQKKIIVAVITCRKYHSSRIARQKLSWASPYERSRQPTVEVVFFSDFADPSIPTVNTGCAATKFGLPCKTAFAMEYMYQEYPYADWYVRAMDDTFFILRNLVWHLSRKNAHSALVVGDFFYSPLVKMGTGGRPACDVENGEELTMNMCYDTSEACRQSWVYYDTDKSFMLSKELSHSKVI
jgi:hypothetical protein